MIRHAAAALLGTVVLAACAGAGATSDLERTWDHARVVLPPLGAPGPVVTTMGSAAMASHLARLPPGGRLPVVVYLHGCTGIGNDDFLRTLAGDGFAVVAPDSFARTWRPLQCDPRTRSGGYNVFVYDFRLAETAYALGHLWQQPWADWNRMALVGSSEGGVAAALYRGDEFRGRVVLQWTCSGAAHVRGVAAPAGEPVMTVVGAEDPWYVANRRQDCGALLAGRPASRSLVVDGRGHDVLGDSGVVEEVREFLRALISPSPLAGPVGSGIIATPALVSSRPPQGT